MRSGELLLLRLAEREELDESRDDLLDDEDDGLLRESEETVASFRELSGWEVSSETFTGVVNLLHSGSLPLGVNVAAPST